MHVCMGRIFQQEGTAHVKSLKQSVPRLNMVYEVKVGVKNDFMGFGPNNVNFRVALIG